MKLYDRVKKILVNTPRARDSDKILAWEVWRELKVTHFDNHYFDSAITLENFLKAPSLESIGRARRKIQEEYPELKGSEEVTKMRRSKAETKGTFIYREEDYCDE